MTDTTTTTDTHSDKATPQSPTAVESRSFEWSEGYETTKTALFRVYSAHAVLQHVRTVTVTQRAASSCEIDTGATLNDVRQDILEELRARGYDLATGDAV
jgi:hypothetical protein